MSKVTVVLTSYNHEKHIKKAIDSVLNQTYKDFELHIWDDCSTDSSWDIIQEYKNKDNRIKNFRTEKNGRGGLFSKALKSDEIKSEYIALIHSDDMWEPTKLEKQVEFLDTHDDIGAVFTKVQPIDENDNYFADKSHFYYSVFDQENRSRFEWLRHFFYKGNCLCHPSVLIRKECYDTVGIYRKSFIQLGDFDMWIRLCMKYDIFILDDKLTKFRIRNNETNVSAGTIENMIREANESFYIFENYKNLTCNDLVKVFPESKKYIVNGRCLSKYILSMMALSKKARQQINLQGINLLYEIINNEKDSKVAKELYDFDRTKLAILSASFDNFNLKIKEQLLQKDKELDRVKELLAQKDRDLFQSKKQLEQKEQELVKTKEQLYKKNKEIELLKDELIIVCTSKSWKITRPLRKIKRRFVK